MEVFVTHVDRTSSSREFERHLKTTLKQFDTHVYSVFKKKDLSWAKITFPHGDRAQRFLDVYGVKNGLLPKEQLYFRDRLLMFRESDRPPDPAKVKELRDEELAAAGSIGLQSLATGLWEYDSSNRLVFDMKFKDNREGTVIFKSNVITIDLMSSGQQVDNWPCRIEIHHGIVTNIVVSHGIALFTLIQPPKIFRVNGEDNTSQTTLSAQIATALLEMAEMNRISTINAEFDKNAAVCMVYCLALSGSAQSTTRSFLNLVEKVPAFRRNLYKIEVSGRYTSSIEMDLRVLLERMSADALPQLDFNTRFQILAVVLRGSVSPRTLLQALPEIVRLANVHGCNRTAAAIRNLEYTIPPGPEGGNHRDQKSFQVQLQDCMEQAIYSTGRYAEPPDEGHALTYKAMITPTGMVLSGPDLAVTNRVLRRYCNHTSYFMRVILAEEDGLGIFYDARVNLEPIYQRFSKVLEEGIQVADRKYEFLGFSHSSLREQTAWFMAPFVDENGRTVRPEGVIQDLGDFGHLRCAAKCAARIGQAFSDTMFSLSLPSSVYVVEDMDDVARNDRRFSDGCGTISPDLLHNVWSVLPPELRKQKPTVLQIRYRGAKGVVSLDNRLGGEQLLVRKSMTKYVAKEGWHNLEICGGGYSPLQMYLNHQFIKILEDLGVPPANFHSVLDDRLRNLRGIVSQPDSAADFLENCQSGTSARVPQLFKLLSSVGLSIYKDSFLTDMIEIAAIQDLRDLKYRARIPVEQGLLAYGIMDETNFLKEGEICVISRTYNKDGPPRPPILVRDRVVVTRAPALHPGDVRVVRAVEPPPDSSLWALHSCVVFSQQGARDLPSQLSGGDLDGDLFHVIWDERLIPPTNVGPADYPPAPAKSLDRPVTKKDMTDFVIEFMKADVLGIVSTRHKVCADYFPTGTLHPDCIQLAELASRAVDFSKSGNPVDRSLIPRLDRKMLNLKPDWMAPHSDVRLTDLGVAFTDDTDAVDSSRIRYYKSLRVLGELFRSIDEKRFLDHMQREFRRDAGSRNTLIPDLKEYIATETAVYEWKHHRGFAEQVRKQYEANMVEIMHYLTSHRGQALREIEVFSGNILGKKERASTKAIREANAEVRTSFNRMVKEIIDTIEHGYGAEGDREHEDSERLPRALACFYVALEDWGKVGAGAVPWWNLKSFKYVAAEVCVEQLYRANLGVLRPFVRMASDGLLRWKDPG